MIERLKQELPFSNVCVFGNFNSIKNIGLQIVNALKDNGFLPTVFVTGNKDLTIENLTGYFNVKENVRSIITLDESAYSLCEYISSVKNAMLIKVVSNKIPLCFFPNKLVIRVDKEYTLYNVDTKSIVIIDNSTLNIPSNDLEDSFINHLINSIDSAVFLTKDKALFINLLDKIIFSYDKLDKGQITAYLIVLGILYNDYHLSALNAFNTLLKTGCDTKLKAKLILDYIIKGDSKGCDYNLIANKISSLLDINKRQILSGLKEQINKIKKIDKSVCYSRIIKRANAVYNFLLDNNYFNKVPDDKRVDNLELLGDLPFSFNAFSIIREKV